MNDVYEVCKSFLKKYPRTLAWHVKRHASVISQHINDDEVVLFSFAGQKDTSLLMPFYTTVIVFTNKRMLLGRKRCFGRYFYTSITPDLLNDFEVQANILFGSVEIDTIKEHFIISGLDKRGLPKIEDALSKYLVNEKLKYLKNKSSN